MVYKPPPSSGSQTAALFFLLLIYVLSPLYPRQRHTNDHKHEQNHKDHKNDLLSVGSEINFETLQNELFQEREFWNPSSGIKFTLLHLFAGIIF